MFKQKCATVLLVIASLLLAPATIFAREDFYQPAISDFKTEKPGWERIITTDNGTLMGFEQTGPALAGFPVKLTNKVVASSPLVANFDQTPEQEIAVVTRTSGGQYGLTVLANDGSEITSTDLEGEVYYDPTAITRANGPKGILISNDQGKVQIYSLSNGALESSTVAEVGEPAGASVNQSGNIVVVNLPQSNELKVYNSSASIWTEGTLISTTSPVTYPVEFGASSKVYAVTNDNKLVGYDVQSGLLLNGFPTDLGKQAIATPKYAELKEENTSKELLVQFVDGSAKVYTLSGAPLTSLSSRSFFSSSFVSFDEDTALTVFASSPIGFYTNNGTYESLTSIYGHFRNEFIEGNLGLPPQIAIQFEGNELLNNATAPRSEMYIGEPKTFTGTITNSGLGNLVFENSPPLNLTYETERSAVWTMTEQPPAIIPPGQSASFSFSVEADVRGTYNGQLTFGTNDPLAEQVTLNFKVNAASTRVENTTVTAPQIVANNSDELTFNVTVRSVDISEIKEVRFVCNHQWHTANQQICYLQWLDTTNQLALFGANNYFELGAYNIDETSDPNRITFTFNLRFKNFTAEQLNNILATNVYEYNGASTSWQPAKEDAYFDVVLEEEEPVVTEPTLVNFTVEPTTVTAGGGTEVVFTAELLAPDPAKQDYFSIQVNHPWHSDGRPRYGLFNYDKGQIREIGNAALYGNDKVTLLNTSTRTVTGNRIVYTFRVLYDTLPTDYLSNGLLGNTVSLIWQAREGTSVTYTSNWKKQAQTFDVTP